MIYKKSDNGFFVTFADLPAVAQAKAGFATFAVKIKYLRLNRIISFLIVVSIPFTSFSQNEKLSEEIISIAEELALDESDPEAVSMYIEQLHELSQNPVNINSADESEISRLFFLSDFQVRALADYVSTSGIIVTAYEIAAIPGFDRQTTEMIIPFISLAPEYNKLSDTIKLRSTFLSNLVIKPGENDTSSLGSSYKFMSKYKFTAGRITGGFTLEKDQGEEFFTGSPSLPDFLSGYLSFSGKGIIRKFIIGDFS